MNETNNNALNQRKGIKIRSPRKLETPIVAQPVTISHSGMQPPPLIPTVTPAALVVSKTVESQHTVNAQNQSNSIQQLLPNVCIVNFIIVIAKVLSMILIYLTINFTATAIATTNCCTKWKGSPSNKSTKYND